MTIKQLYKILKGLPEQMDVAIEAEDGKSINPISFNTNVVQVKFDDTKKETFVLVIKSCAWADDEASRPTKKPLQEKT